MSNLTYQNIVIDLQLAAAKNNLEPTMLLVHPDKNLGELLSGTRMNIGFFQGLPVIMKDLGRDYAVAVTGATDEIFSSYVLALDENGNISEFWHKWQ